MNDKNDEPRGAAAWRAQRDAVAKRNADARKRGQAERKEHEGTAAARRRVEDARENSELEELNAKMAERWRAG